MIDWNVGADRKESEPLRRDRDDFLAGGVHRASHRLLTPEEGERAELLSDDDFAPGLTMDDFIPHCLMDKTPIATPLGSEGKDGVTAD